jgi:hypothetical protein
MTFVRESVCLKGDNVSKDEGSYPLTIVLLCSWCIAFKSKDQQCSHVDLVQRYEIISIEQDNSLLCIAQLVNRNTLLKDQVERLKFEI